MIDKMNVTAIILAAGNSIRFGKNKNKNFELINGKTVLSYSLNLFNKNNYIDNIMIAVKSSDIKTVKDIIQKEQITKETQLILGGLSRQESVYNCIKKCNSDIVLIHDGARPLLKKRYIDKCIENMKDYKGVTIGVKSKDTIKISDENNLVINTTERNNTWLIQTPQCFYRKILLDAHEKYKNENAFDDCILLEKNNYKIKILEGDYTNIKITTFEDLNIIRHFFN